MNDNYIHKGKRKRLTESLKSKGISDSKVLEAIKYIPRHLFIDPIFEHHAYDDKPFSIGEGQTISHPYTVAFQTQLLGIKPEDKILEIGTGSGYQASILYQLSKNIYSIEQSKMLFQKTKKLLLSNFNYKINLFFGDGSIGLEKHAPFDKIIVTAGAPIMNESLKKQLKIGGILVIPVGDSQSQKMIRVTKEEEELYTYETFSDFSFVPLVGEKGW